MAMENVSSPLNLRVIKNTLVVNFPAAYPVLSWAPLGGGDAISSCVFNHQNDEFDEGDLDTLFADVKADLQLPTDSIGLITGCHVKNYQDKFLKQGSLWVHGIATVGLTNARTAGDQADVPLGVSGNKPGTINIILACNALPKLTGRLEAVHTITMAKTATLIGLGVKSLKSGLPATGTGTDCIAVIGTGEIDENYCGMHTVLGEMIGQVVNEIISKAVKANKKIFG
jgi:adenosylcobinamide amidohydrolase